MIHNGMAHTRRSRPSSPASSRIGSPMTPHYVSSTYAKGSVNDDTIDEEKIGHQVVFAPKPLHFELDSMDTERPNTAELPVALVGPTFVQDPGLRSASAPGIHPPSLTPGMPGTMNGTTERQGQGRVGNGGLGTATVGNRQMGHVSPDRPARIRATLNATPDDLRKNRHVNSWSHL